MLKVSSADRLALPEDVVGASRQRLAAHAAREAFHVEDQAGHRPHHQIRAADLLHASRALRPEDPLVVRTAVELEVAIEARVRQHRAARRTREAVLVVIPIGDSHHVLVNDDTAAGGADRLEEAGLRLHGNGWLCIIIISCGPERNRWNRRQGLARLALTIERTRRWRIKFQHGVFLLEP